MSQGEDALPNGLDVTFEVMELRRMTGSYNTTVGNNEGSMVSLYTPPDALPAPTPVPPGPETLSDLSGAGDEAPQRVWPG